MSHSANTTQCPCMCSSLLSTCLASRVSHLPKHSGGFVLLSSESRINSSFVFAKY